MSSEPMDLDAALEQVMDQLSKRFKRVPTEDEVVDFLYGDDDERITIWNKEALK